MSPAADPILASDRSPMMFPALISPAASAVSVAPSVAIDMAAKDAILTWYRGEFAAANAIIDALCNHITRLSVSGGAGAPEYEAVFAAIHRRRLNWIPVLQMQKYFSIADVTVELRKVAESKKAAAVTEKVETKPDQVKNPEDRKSANRDQHPATMQKAETANSDGIGGFIESVDEDSPDSDTTDSGSQEVHATQEHREICENHQECGSRRERIRMTKGFVAKEPVKGHMVNVVKGLKMFEDLFTDAEMSRLNEFVDQLRVAGQSGDLSGETYILFNKQVKGSKREQVQLGVPIFGDTHKPKNEPIPEVLQSVIDHLVQWQIVPETRKPNGCIINYYDEGDYSLPYLKPPHLDQPICTLLLSDSTLAFGRSLVNDGEGNFKGHLMLSTPKGSALVMRNHSADMARHAICPSPTKRASITFYRLRPDTRLDTSHSHINNQGKALALAPLTQDMNMWQPGMPNLVPNGFEPAMTMVPHWGFVQSPVMSISPLSPARPMSVNPRKMPRGGTGVFLPWGMRSRKPAKHLPPRALKGRLLALPLDETHHFETMSDPGS